MIETEQQRRWWFATHPEFSWSRGGQKSKHYGDEDEDSDRLKHEKDDFLIELFRDVKFWFGPEAASSNLARLQRMVRGNEESSMLDHERGPASSEDWWSRQPPEHPAAARDTYDKYEDVLDRIHRLKSEDPEREAFIKSFMDAGWSMDQAKEKWAIYQLNQSIARGVAGAVGAYGAITGVPRWAISLGEAGAIGNRFPRLPPKGTPERATIEAARTRGIRAKKDEELADIRGGGKGSGEWTDQELQAIRRTGKFPPDAEWHHDPTVANRPDLASHPSTVRIVRGGRDAHFDAHERNWRNPKE